MSNKQNFQDILEEIRKEIKFLKIDLFNELSKIVSNASNCYNRNLEYLHLFRFTQETRDWLFDAFLDKCYEANVKITRIIEDKLGYKVQLPISDIKTKVELLAFGTYSHTFYVIHALMS